jgi:hypothetical protein
VLALDVLEAPERDYTPIDKVRGWQDQKKYFCFANSTKIAHFSMPRIGNYSRSRLYVQGKCKKEKKYIPRNSMGSFS